MFFHGLVSEPRPTDHNMSENPPDHSRAETSLVETPSLPHKSEDELPTVHQDRHVSTPKPFTGPQKEEERGGGAERSGEMKRLRREVRDLKALLDRVRTEAIRLKGEEEKLMGECKCRDNLITELEHRIERMYHFYQGVVGRKTRHIRAMEEHLEQTKELLATRSAELSEAQAFLSTTDRLSEMEVLGIVRDLNENIYQVAVHLTEEFEKLELPPVTNRMSVDPTPDLQPCVPTLVQLVRNRDLVGLTFLLQSCFCSQAAKISSSRSHREESAILESIYQRLSVSGEHRIVLSTLVEFDSHTIEGQAISARWRALTHSYHSQPPPHSGLLVEQLADILYETGSFPSIQHSLEFVEAVALEGIEKMIRLALRLEFAFAIEVTSSDMSLLFDAPDTRFDDAKMANEFESDGGKQDRIAGTIEVGVGKSICEGAEKGRRGEVLLKTRVVLEKDVMDS